MIHDNDCLFCGTELDGANYRGENQLCISCLVRLRYLGLRPEFIEERMREFRIGKRIEGVNNGRKIV